MSGSINWQVQPRFSSHHPKRFLVKIYPNHSTSHIHGVPELLSSERFSTLTTSEIQKPSTSGRFRAKNRIRRKGVWPRNMQKTFQIDKVPWDAVGFGFMNQMHNWRGTLIHNLAMRRKNYSEWNMSYDPTWIPPGSHHDPTWIPPESHMYPITIPHGSHHDPTCVDTIYKECFGM